jgi:hypothetical protein
MGASMMSGQMQQAIGESKCLGILRSKRISPALYCGELEEATDADIRQTQAERRVLDGHNSAFGHGDSRLFTADLSTPSIDTMLAG